MSNIWNSIRALCWVLAVSLWGTVAHAADTTVTLRPSQDATIYSGVPGSDALADGVGPHLWLGVTGEGVIHRSLLKFDLSQVPPGSVVKQVTLTLWESRSRDTFDVALHRILSSWTEGNANSGSTGAGAPAGNGDVTWSHRSYQTTAWATQGGDIQAQPSSVQSVGTQDQYYSWSATAPASGSSPRLIQDVQAWVDQPAANFGWMMIGNETSLASAKRLESRNYFSEPRQPQLLVTYGPAVVAGAGDGDTPLPMWALAALALGLLSQLVPSLNPRRFWK